MSNLIRGSKKLSDEQREAFNANHHWVPVLVLLSLALCAVLCTDWLPSLIEGSPGWFGAEHSIFRRSMSKGFFRSEIWVHFGTTAVGSNGERKILLGLTALAFLAFYYLPMRWKRPPAVALTFLGIGWIMGPAALGGLLACHLINYSVFHLPGNTRRFWLGTGATGFGLCWPEHSARVFIDLDWAAGTQFLVWSLLTGGLLGLLFRALVVPLTEKGWDKLFRRLSVHGCLIYVVLTLIANWRGLALPISPLGLLLFFWQWERLVMYQIDFQDDQVPVDLPLASYLATFFSPGMLATVSWLNRIPKGYAYMADRFLARDKNAIALDALKLLAMAVLFGIIRLPILEAFRAGGAFLGYEIYSYGSLARSLSSGSQVGLLSIWMSVLKGFFSFYFFWTAVAHFKVALWRLSGYDIETHFQYPFIATNFVEFWRRYSFYYREFLVSAFYFPVFLKVARKNRTLRIFVATFAAAAGGNFTWHMIESALHHKAGATPEILMAQLRTLPYYLVLGLLISLTQVWIVKQGRRRRKPWTRGWRVSLDVLSVVLVVMTFSLLRPLRHVPIKGSVGGGIRIVLAGCGLHFAAQADELRSLMKAEYPPFKVDEPIRLSASGSSEGFTTLSFKNPSRRKIRVTLKVKDGRWTLMPNRFQFTLKSKKTFKAMLSYRMEGPTLSHPRIEILLAYRIGNRWSRPMSGSWDLPVGDEP